MLGGGRWSSSNGKGTQQSNIKPTSTKGNDEGGKGGDGGRSYEDDGNDGDDDGGIGGDGGDDDNKHQIFS